MPTRRCSGSTHAPRPGHRRGRAIAHRARVRALEAGDQPQQRASCRSRSGPSRATSAPRSTPQDAPSTARVVAERLDEALGLDRGARSVIAAICVHGRIRVALTGFDRSTGPPDQRPRCAVAGASSPADRRRPRAARPSVLALRRSRRPRRLQRPLAVRRRAGVQGVRGADRARGRAARRHGARAVRAAAPRGRRHAGRPARDHRPREPLARRAGRAARAGHRRRRSSAHVPRRVPRPATATWWGISTAHPHADALHRARARPTPSRATRTSATRASSGRLCLRTSQQRVQPVARRRHASPSAARAATERLLRVVDGERPAHPRLRRRRAGGDRRRPLRRRPHEPLLPRPHAQGRPDFPVAPAWPDQDGAGAHTNLSGVGLVKGTEHRADAIALMEFLDRAARRRSTIVGEQRVRGQPGRAAGRAHPRLGRRQAATRSTSSAPAPVLPAGRRADAAGRVAVAGAAGRGRGAPAAGCGAGRHARRAARRRAAARAARLVPQRPAARSTQIADDLLPEALRASLVLAAGVGAGTLLARRRARRARLVLRLPRPPLARLGARAPARDARLRARVRPARPVRRRRARCSAPRAVRRGFQLPEIRTTAGRDRGADARPLPVRVRARAQRVPRQSRQTFEAARTLGLSHGAGGRAASRCRWRGRRSRAGVALAVMEALADFGAVNLLGYRAMTDAIYRVWYGAFDQAGRAPARHRAGRPRAHARARSSGCCAAAPATTARSRAARRSIPRRPARRPRRWRPRPRRSLLLAVVFVAPVGQLARLVGRSRSATARRRPRSRATALRQPAARRLAAVLAVLAATVVVYGRRARPSRHGARRRAPAARSATRCPGTVVAVAVYVPLAWVDRRLDAPAARHRSGCCSRARRSGWSSPTSCASTRSRTCRVDARMAAHRPRARRRRAQPRRRPHDRVLADVHLPLLWPGMLDRRRCSSSSR